MGQCLAIIPARSGSKRLSGKNGLRLGGRTLVELAVECAQESGVCDDICITSDDGRLRDHPDAYSIPRPPWLAADGAMTAHVVQHAIGNMWDELRREYDSVMVLQPTSPLRSPKHLVSCFDILNSPWKAAHRDDWEATHSVTSVTPAKYPPGKLCDLDGKRLVIPDQPSRSQEHLPAVYRDGVCYLVRAEFAAMGDLYGTNRRYFLTPAPCGVSIDTADDWEEAQRIWRKQNERVKSSA